MSAKRQAENLDETSPAKKQKLSNGATSTGAPAPAQSSTATMMEKIAKAKKALEMQKTLQAKLAAAGVKVRLSQTWHIKFALGKPRLTCMYTVYLTCAYRAA